MGASRAIYLVQLVNISGHSETAYFRPVPMKDIEVELKGEFKHAMAVREGKTLTVSRSGQYSRFVLPALDDYELVEVQ